MVAVQKKRDQPWLMRTYSGHSSAKASNALYRTNLAKGQTGLSVAFDLPTQTGYDADSPLARGEVGKVGVPISSIEDMDQLFDQIPLDQMNTSMTINATAAWLLSLYIGLAQRRGIDREKTERYHPERHHQGVSLARHLHLSARPIDAPDRGYDQLHGQTCAEVESDQHLQLPPAGGGGHAGAGTGLCPVHRDGGA
jgi:hypothetical protein